VTREAAADLVARTERLRVCRDRLIGRLLGKKVTASTSDFHYLCGQLLALEPDGRLRFAVEGRQLLVHRDAVARIHEADPALAEYLK